VTSPMSGTMYRCGHAAVLCIVHRACLVFDYVMRAAWSSNCCREVTSPMSGTMYRCGAVLQLHVL
jgi:hypothetical protein